MVESLKATPGVDLETCYVRILCKAADVAKPKPKDQNTLTHREMRINLPQTSNPPLGKIYILKHKKESGVIFLPQDLFKTLSCESRKELSMCSNEVRGKGKGMKMLHFHYLHLEFLSHETWMQIHRKGAK